MPLIWSSALFYCPVKGNLYLLHAGWFVALTLQMTDRQTDRHTGQSQRQLLSQAVSGSRGHKSPIHWSFNHPPSTYMAVTSHQDVTWTFAANPVGWCNASHEVSWFLLKKIKNERKCTSCMRCACFMTKYCNSPPPFFFALRELVHLVVFPWDASWHPCTFNYSPFLPQFITKQPNWMKLV